MPSTEPLVADELYTQLEQALLPLKNDPAALYRAIVELPFEHAKEMALLFMGFLCYFSVDRAGKQLQLEAATDNEYYRESIAGYDVSQEHFVWPLSATDNAMVQAFTTGKPVSLTNWDKLRRPEVEEGVARLNQATSGIAYSVIYPIADHGVLGFNLFQPKEMLPADSEAFITRYSQLITTLMN